MWGEADSRKRGGLVRWNEWGAVKKNAKSSTLAECKIWEVGFEENVVRSVEGVAGDFENTTEHLCPAVCTTIWIQHTLSHALFCYVTLNLFKVWGDFFIPAKSTFSKHDWKELLSKYFFYLLIVWLDVGTFYFPTFKFNSRFKWRISLPWGLKRSAFHCKHLILLQL